MRIRLTLPVLSLLTVVLVVPLRAESPAAAAPATRPAGRPFEVIQQWQATGRLRPDMLEDHWFADARAMGVTSFQSYVHWSEVEPEPGAIDFGHYDPLVAKLREHGVKWVPFIIAGPYYSTPEWFRASDESVYARCLEHDQETPIQSIWNPAMPERVDRFLRVLAEHYAGTGVLESVLLGISGNWGESIYPVGGGFQFKDEFHTHGGLWCGDAHAARSFRAWLVERHATAEAMGNAWGSDVESFEKVTPQDARRLGGAARRDLMRWYLESMTDYAQMWVVAAGRQFPGVKVYLCTGGNGNPAFGADFAQQARMCAKHGAGLRITNLNDVYAEFFPICRWLVTACKHYGAPLTTEPAGANSAAGIPARVFDGLSVGADGLYFKKLVADSFRRPYARTGFPEVFARYRPLLGETRPRVEAAVYYPQGLFIEKPGELPAYFERCRRLRDLVDLDMLDDTLIADGALEHYEALVVLPPAVLSGESQSKVEGWKSAKTGRTVCVPRGERGDLMSAVKSELEGRVRGDWREDGVYCTWTDAGVLILNTRAEPGTAHVGAEEVHVPAGSVVLHNVLNE